MAQYTWTLQHADTLPAIAEACGHSGEWIAITESAPWLEGLDYLAVAPGSAILLPEGWVPPGTEVEPEPEPEPEQQQDYASMTAAQLVDLAKQAQTLGELDAIDNAANGRATVESAVDTRRQQLLDMGATA